MHTVCHFEIPSTDPTASAEFYHQLFGWKMEKFGKDYILILLNDEDSGGIYPVEKIKPSQIAIYIEVDDIPSTLEHVTELGGTIVEEKRNIGEHGYVGSFKDPQGVQIELWSKN